MLGEADVALAALGIVGTIAGALIWLLKKLFQQNTNTLAKLSASNETLAKSIDQLSRTSERMNKTLDNQEKNSAEWQKYVTERFNVLQGIGDRLLSQKITEQTVHHQTVINQATE
jgi:hypothetical protein